MTETNFTLGPWKGKVDGKYQSSDWEANNDTAMTYEYAPVVDEQGRTVCLVVHESASFMEDDTPIDYNAQLIASAPELYALLEIAACPCCDGSGAYYDGYGEVFQCQWCDERAKVIAKARGES